MSLPVSEIYAGMELPGRQKKVVQENVDLYAEASRDYNPIHIDEEFARKTPAGAGSPTVCSSYRMFPR